MTRRTAALVVHARDSIAEHRQWALLLEWCRAERVEPASLVRGDPAAAVLLAAAGLVDLVVAAFPDAAGVLEDAESAGVPVVFMRRSNRRRQSSSHSLIASMLSRGGSVELVAQLLGLTAAEVQMVANVRRPGQTNVPAGPRPRQHVHH